MRGHQKKGTCSGTGLSLKIFWCAEQVVLPPPKLMYHLAMCRGCGLPVASVGVLRHVGRNWQPRCNPITLLPLVRLFTIFTTSTASTTITTTITSVTLDSWSTLVWAALAGGLSRGQDDLVPSQAGAIDQLLTPIFGNISTVEWCDCADGTDDPSGSHLLSKPNWVGLWGSTIYGTELVFPVEGESHAVDLMSEMKNWLGSRELAQEFTSQEAF